MASKLVKGTIVLSIATLLSKILGTLFWIPFQNIAGNGPVGVYRISFPFYSILLMVASAGIPITVSKFVAERLSLNDYVGARRILTAATIILSITGIFLASFLFFGADFIAHVLLHNPPTKTSLQVLAIAIAIVPVMAALRGYFQGHQDMMPTGLSQVVEQIVRVGTVILLIYLFVSWGLSDEYVAAGATAGAAFGALAGLLVVLWYNRRDKKKHQIQLQQQTQSKEPLGRLMKNILAYAIPISLATLVLPLISLVDSFTVPYLLRSMGKTLEQTNDLFGIYGRGEPLVNVISTFSSALTLTLIPVIASLVAKKEMEAVSEKVRQAWQMTLLISLPACLGLCVIAEPVNIAMYTDDSGTTSLAVLTFSAIFSTLAVTSSGILQGLGYNKIPVRHLLIGAAIKVGCNFLFIPYLGITGSALAMVVCYFVVCTLNMWMVMKKTQVKISITQLWAKPLFCAVLMSTILFVTYQGLQKLFIMQHAGRLSYILASILLILLGAVIYLILLLLTKSINEEELRMLPMGDRLVNLFVKLHLIRKTNVSS